MTLLIVLVNEVGQNQLVVVQQQSFHVRAVVEEVLDDCEDLIAVFELNGKQVDIEHDVNNGN
jgi:hypothetical protein